MKRFISLTLIIILIMISLNPMVTRAQSGRKIIILINSSKIIDNGELKYIDESNPYAFPVIRNDRTLVPVRFLSETFGAWVHWDAPSQTVSISFDNRTARLVIGSKIIDINGEESTMETAAQIIENRTYVPLRVLSQKILNKYVYYEDNLGCTWMENMARNTSTCFCQISFIMTDPCRPASDWRIFI